MDEGSLGFEEGREAKKKTRRFIFDTTNQTQNCFYELHLFE